MKAQFASMLLVAAEAVDLESFGYGRGRDYGYDGYDNAGYLSAGYVDVVGPGPTYNFLDTNHYRGDRRTIQCPEGEVFNCSYDYKHYGIYDSSDYEDDIARRVGGHHYYGDSLDDSDIHDYIYRDGYGGVDLTDSDSDYYGLGHYNHYSFSDDDQGYYGFSASDDDYYNYAGLGDLGYRYEGPDFSNAYGGQRFYRVVVCDDRNTNCRNEYRPGGYPETGGYGGYGGLGYY